MVSNPGIEPESSLNYLFRLASAGGVLLGIFFLAAAYGHFSAVWSTIDSGAGISASRFSLLLPGLLLVLSGLIDIGLCRVLWKGLIWALQLALVLNLLAAMYFVYLLLSQSAPGHPIGPFVAVVSSYCILLGAIRVGLIWPA